ncbi:MAG: hypothetical protein JOY59_04040, partial [Candidatus Eremiobacteraeota bacterium]|nr:hypothetical protein [Candidatus Eremiobacteraeota bacterium]
MLNASVLRALLVAALLAPLAACHGAAGGDALPPPQHVTPPGSGPKGAHGVDHIVIAIQENRSFDNLFHAFPGADTTSTGRTHTGGVVKLQQIPLNTSYDLSHQVLDFVRSFDNGKMDGFDLGTASGPGAPPLPEYAYAREADVNEYWKLAAAYTLADRTFSSQIDSSFSAHQYLIAAQNAWVVDGPTAVPWGCDAPAGTTIPLLSPNRTPMPGPFPCFDYHTLGDELDSAGISWRYYEPEI